MATRRRQNRSLDLETIVARASELIAEEGFEALTMRRLAERCGVTAMSLYRYVQTKEDLLVLLANRALEELELPEAGAGSWRDEITAVFGSLHRLLLSHPEFVRIMASRPIDAVAAYRGMEVVLAALQREGLDDDEAVTAYEALVSFTRGFHLHYAGPPRQATPPLERLSSMRELRPEEFPHVVKLAGQLVMSDEDRRFDDGLALVVRGIADQIDSKRSAG